MVYYINILRDYKMDEAVEEANQKQIQQEVSDKIIIYNEIIEVIRSIYLIYLQKERERKRQIKREQKHRQVLETGPTNIGVITYKELARKINEREESKRVMNIIEQHPVNQILQNGKDMTLIDAIHQLEEHKQK